MKILSFRALSGPNLFAYFPVLRMRLDLEDLAERESNAVEGFIERLQSALPGIAEHHCSRGHAGGFLERLHEGTYFGHIVEHVALELSSLAGVDATFGKTVYGGNPGVYDVVVEYDTEPPMRLLLATAVQLVELLVQGEAFDFKPAVEEARELAVDTALGPSTRAIVEAAKQRGVPYVRLNDESLVVLGYGKHRRFIQATTTSQTSYVAVEVASDKELTKCLLDRAGLPVPHGKVVTTEEDALEAAASLTHPLVVKPLDGNQGRGVSLNLSRSDEIRQAFGIAREQRPRVLIEEMVIGENFRGLVVGGKLVAMAQRAPAHVVGDGVHTARELVEIENANPLRAAGHSGVLTRLEIDAIVHAYLAKVGRSLDDVPAADELFLLRDGVNLSTGGTAQDVTDSVHPENVLLCERAARAIDLDVCGIDLVMRDVSRPISEGGAIIEVNAAPGIRMHEHPSQGAPRRVGAAILESLYPAGAPSRIPIVAVTGTNGKTTTTRLIGHVFGQAGVNVGMTTTDGIWIGGRAIERGDDTGPGSARVVLFDPSVELAVLETARGGIVRRGLGFDWCDVAVLTNIALDHIGQDGIETIDDILHVKSLVAERVREGGTVVLNAEDACLAELPSQRRMQRVQRKVVFFALDPANGVLVHHIATGGVGYTIVNDFLVEQTAAGSIPIISVMDLPFAFDGAARFHLANALAAAAACRALDASLHLVQHALSGFGPEMNPGRANLYAVNEGYVLLDYAHNPRAIEATCAMTQAWAERRLVAVLSLPGDRADELLRLTAAVAARSVDRLIVKEDRDRRGRAPGEVASLVADIARAEAPHLPCEVILDERAAITHALESMAPGEVVLIFTDDCATTLHLLKEHGATPARSVGKLVRSGVPHSMNEKRTA